jgi:4-hydroxymandelate oxidase
VKDLVHKVEVQGCKALVITVDTPISGARDRQVKAHFKLPDDIKAPYMIDTAFASKGEVLKFKKSLTWSDIEWLQSLTKLPVLLKGILNPEDAEKAIKSGVEGIIVSNHEKPRHCTSHHKHSAIAKESIKRIPVLMDGGIRRADVVKAIALGASAVRGGNQFVMDRLAEDQQACYSQYFT